MASNPNEEDDANRKPSLKYKDVISSLPVEHGWVPVPLRNYKGFWFPEQELPARMSTIDNFKARPTDLILATSAECGTAWLKALAFATVYRNKYPLSRIPLRTTSPNDCVPFMEILFKGGPLWELQAMHPPRVLATHSPFSLLPPSVVDEPGCRLVYVCRDPKDAFVSLWHHWIAKKPEAARGLPVNAAFDAFSDGVSPFGPVWDHFLEYWSESQRRPEKVLFLKYEDIMEDQLGCLKKLAEFSGCPFTDQEEKDGVLDEILKMCSVKKLSELELKKTVDRATDVNMMHMNPAISKMGKVGEWKNHLSSEMARELDGVTRQKLLGSGVFDSYSGQPSYVGASARDQVPPRAPATDEVALN